MKYLLFLITLSFILFVSAVPQYAQGKSDQAPGQVKKTKAVVGTVDTVNPTSVTVQEKTGNRKTELTVDSATKIVDRSKKEIKIGAIKLKDIVAYIATDSGAATGSGKLRVNKIFVKEASSAAQLKRRAVQGVITAINGNVLTVAHQIQRDQDKKTFSVVVTDQTIIKMKSTEASGSASLATSSATLANLAVGQRIVAVGDINPDGGITAKKIHVIPGKATGVFKRNPVATPSASTKASPRASASATPSSSVRPSASPSATASASPGV